MVCSVRAVPVRTQSFRARVTPVYKRLRYQSRAGTSATGRITAGNSEPWLLWTVTA